MKNLFKISLVLFSMIFAVSCSDDDEGTPQPDQLSIAEFVANNPNYSSLGAALDAAGLTATLNGDTQFTVFAPDNAAFSAFLEANGFASLGDVPTDLLTSVLLNHVVSGVNESKDLTTGYVNSLATFGNTEANLSMFINTNGGVTINNGVNVVVPDVAASNGVIHGVDEVIALPTIVTKAISNPDFSILVDALVAASSDDLNYVNLLSGNTNAPFTVFAPTNDAFVSLLGELEVNSLDEIPVETLRATLNTHVITGANVRAEDLTSGTVSTFGDDIIIDAANTTITDPNGRVSNIIVTNVQASNGVVHAIDKVILPQL